MFEKQFNTSDIVNYSNRIQSKFSLTSESLQSVQFISQSLNSNYWKDITSGNFSHYHNNPKLPHSFEVYPGFWWEGKNNGYGNIEYSTVISTIQFAEELGDRLINKING